MKTYMVKQAFIFFFLFFNVFSIFILYIKNKVFIFHFYIFVYLDASLKFGERRHIKSAAWSLYLKSITCLEILWRECLIYIKAPF
jgi:hypothetical protein